jgi:hypothetical protein
LHIHPDEVWDRSYLRSDQRFGGYGFNFDGNLDIGLNLVFAICVKEARCTRITVAPRRDRILWIDLQKLNRALNVAKGECMGNQPWCIALRGLLYQRKRIRIWLKGVNVTAGERPKECHAIPPIPASDLPDGSYRMAGHPSV